jgi:hypothetical protein
MYCTGYTQVNTDALKSYVTAGLDKGGVNVAESVQPPSQHSDIHSPKLRIIECIGN